MVRDIPISEEDKNRLTESWILDVLQPLIDVQIFPSNLSESNRSIKTQGE